MKRIRLYSIAIACISILVVSLFKNKTAREENSPKWTDTESHPLLSLPLEANSILPDSQFIESSKPISRVGPFEIIWIDEEQQSEDGVLKVVALLRDNRNDKWLRLEDSTDSTEIDQQSGSSLMLADSLLAKLTPSQFRSLLAKGYAIERLEVSFDYYRISIEDFNVPGNFKRTLDSLAKELPTTVIEPDIIYWSTATTPSDPDFENEQWALQASGDGSIDAPLAWDATNSAAGVKIAILDTGIDIDHEDLIPNLWRNSGETEENGIDDDENGYIDDINGFSFIRSSSNIDDINGHGTHVAGIAAASGNNGIGIAGVAWKADLVGIQVLNDKGYGPTSAVVQGIAYANLIGAKIINMSLSSSTKSEILEDAINSTEAQDALIVASAGNNYSNIDSSKTYPAGYPNERIISVSASNRAGHKADFSNFGETSVDLAAPGTYIHSTYPIELGSYKKMSGTSMSAPMVSGTLALIQKMTPNLNALQRKDRILDGLNRFQRFGEYNLGSGILNANNALRGIKTGPYYDSFKKALRLHPSRETWKVSNVQSSRESGEPNHNGSSSNTTIWALIVYDSQVAAEIAVDSNEMSADIEIYTGSSIGRLNSVAKGDSNTPARFTAKSGEIYRIAISGRNNAEGELEILLGQRPENDDLDGATKIEGDEYSVSTSNVGSTSELNEPPHGSSIAYKTLWWEYTPSESAKVRMDTTGSNFDTSLAVYTGTSINNLTLIASNDNANGQTETSAIDFQGVANTTYFVAVGSSNDGVGLLQLKVGLLKPLSILEHPKDTSPQMGGNATFRVVANQSSFTTYQWYLNGTPLSNQISDRLVLDDINRDFVGTYKVSVSNGIETKTSQNATLVLGYTKNGIAINPTSTSIPTGESGFLHGGIDTDSPLDYQWYKNGNRLFGKTSATLLIEGASQSDSGLYYLEASGSFGTMRTNQALVFVEDQNDHDARTFWPNTSQSDQLHVKELERQFFLLGHPNALYQSSNGKTWLKLVPGLQGRVTEIVYDGSRYYAFSDQFEGAWTSDFKNWTTFALSTDFKLTSVFYGNSVFVAEAHQADDWTVRQIAVSSNGEDWTIYQGENHPRDIAYGNGIFIGGNGYQAFRSTNGSSWEVLEGAYSTEVVLFSGSEFLLTEPVSIRGEDPVVSSDGYDWQATFPRGFHREMYASGGVWFAHDRTFPSFDYSVDSREFKESRGNPEAETNQSFTIAHSNGDVVLVSEEGLLLNNRLGAPLPDEAVSYSDPGYAKSLNKAILDLRLGLELKFANPLSIFDLKEQVVDPLGTLDRIEVWANGKKEAEAFPPEFKLAWRPASYGELDIEIRGISDGESYTMANEQIISLVPMPNSLNPKFDDLAGLAHFKGRFYRISSQGSLQQSENGIDWQGVPLPQYGRFYSILANGRSIIVRSDDMNILQSSDGVNWNLRSVEDDLNFSFENFTLIDDTFYFYVNANSGLVGLDSQGSGVIFYSRNGIDWRSMIPFPQMEIKDLAVSNGLLLGKFVANHDEFGPADLGIGNLQAGNKWEMVDSIDGSSITDIDAFNGYFAATTSSNKVFYSSEGKSWIQAAIEIEGEIHSVKNISDRLSVASTTGEIAHEKTTHLYETTDYRTWSSSQFERYGKYDMIDSVSNGQVTASIWTSYLWSFPIRGHLRLSINGGPWRDANLSGEYIKIDWNGKQFIAVGPSGSIAKSNDGLSWTETGGSYWDRTSVEGHAWFKGKLYVSIDNSLYRYDKIDGLVNLKITSNGYIAATETLLAVANWGQTDTDSRLYLSSDGESFSEVTFNEPIRIEHLSATRTHLISIRSGQGALYSDDGRNWNVMDPGFDISSNNTLRVLENGYVYIEKNSSSFVLSSDLSNWETIDHSLNVYIENQAYAEGEYWFYVNDPESSNNILSTSDFSNWTGAHYSSTPLLGFDGRLSGGITGSESGAFLNGEIIFHQEQPNKTTPFALSSKRIGASAISAQHNILTLKSNQGYLGIIPLGDLAIGEIAISSEEDVAMVGDTITGSIKIVNLGLETVHIAEGTRLEFFVQNDSSEEQSIVLRSFALEIQSLNSGSTISIPFETRVPNSITPGPLYIGGHIDTEDASFEMNEYNNRYVQPTAIGTIDAVTVTVNVLGDGYVNSSIELDNVAANDLVELFPVAQNLDQFVEWSGDYGGTLTPASFSASQNMTINAKFAKLLSLEIQTEGGGTVSATPENQLVEAGQLVELTAEPDPGWTFVGWNGDLNSSNPQESFSISEDMSISARFSFDYDTWLSDHFNQDELVDPKISSPESDPDKDGLPNLMEAVLQTSPNDPEPNSPFNIRFDGTTFSISFTEIRDWNDIAWNVQSRNSTSNWIDHPFNQTMSIIDSKTLHSDIDFEADFEQSTIYRLTVSRSTP